MRDKHLHIAEDSALLQTIYKKVEAQLVVNPQRFALHLWMKFVFYFSLFVVSYAFLYTLAHPLVFIFGYMAYGFVSLLFAFNFSHDFSHNTIFKSNRWNHV